MINIAMARANANKLREAVKQIQNSINDLNGAYAFLDSGATTNKIKQEIKQIKEVIQSLENTTRQLLEAANNIETTAYEIRTEEEVEAQNDSNLPNSGVWQANYRN